jgi:CheY-like chemotaxis protein
MENEAVILAAEDEESDQVLLKIALQQAGLVNPLILVGDGQETIDYLAGRGPYSNRASYPLPGLLLLDLKMPRLTGFDVLEWLANRPELAYLPAVVMSSSSLEADLSKARSLGAREYLIKPHRFGTLVGMLQDAVARWLVKPPACARTLGRKFTRSG